MLGSEYNWLVTLHRPANGTPQVRMAGDGLLTITIAVFCLLSVALRAEPPHRALLREAAAAGKADDIPLQIARLEAARALRPDYPRVIYALARAYAAAGRPDDALAQLDELAAMGLHYDIAKDDALAALRARPEFAALVPRLAASATSPTTDPSAWAVTGMDGIIEGLALHPTTGEAFFSDVHNRCIWYRDVGGDHAVMKKFSVDTDGLLGVFALKIDAAGATLWASCSALPEMKDCTASDKGRAFLAEYDLSTRKLRRIHPLPADGREHVLGDLLLTGDGTVYVSDSVSPVIWRLVPGGTRLENWLEHGDFVSLQGLALGADRRTLIVADYANGLWRIDLATRTVALLPPPAHRTLFGIDGLYAVPGGLVAVQNGVNPQRIVRLTFAADGRPGRIETLLSGHPTMTDLGLGQVVKGRLHFIGNSGWELYARPAATPAPRPVTVLHAPVD